MRECKILLKSTISLTVSLLNVVISLVRVERIVDFSVEISKPVALLKSLISRLNSLEV